MSDDPLKDARRARKILLALPHMEVVRPVHKLRAVEFDTDTMLIMPTVEDCLVAFFDATLSPMYCNICLQAFDNAERQNCGGDCLTCMAEFHDPDCEIALAKLMEK